MDLPTEQLTSQLASLRVLRGTRASTQERHSALEIYLQKQQPPLSHAAHISEEISQGHELQEEAILRGCLRGYLSQK